MNKLNMYTGSTMLEWEALSAHSSRIPGLSLAGVSHRSPCGVGFFPGLSSFLLLVGCSKLTFDMKECMNVFECVDKGPIQGEFSCLGPVFPVHTPPHQDPD